MQKKTITLVGYEVLEKPIKRFEGTTNKVYVPKDWVKCVLVRTA